MARVAWCLVLLASAAACSDLSPITADVCGNGALDPGEDCDGSAGSGQACGAPADANACFFTCGSGDSCPAGYACGLDLRCRAPSGHFALAPGPVKFLATSFHAADVDGDGYADLTGLDGDRLQVYFGNARADLQDVSTQIVPTSGVGPAFGDLDGDGLTDVITATTIGAVTLLGGSGGYAPHPYASIDLDGSTGGIRIEQGHALGSPSSDLFEIYDQLASGKQGQLAFTASDFATCFDGTVVTDQPCPGASPGSAVETLQSGDVAIGRTGFVWTCATPDVSCAGTSESVDPTDEVAVPVVGATHVPLLTATEGLAGPSTLALAHVQDVALVTGTVVAASGRTMFADLDNDGCADLVIPTTGLATQMNVAFDAGCSGKLNDGVGVPNTAFTKLIGVAQGVPRLFADLDGDGIADVVSNTQIFLATCTGSGCRTAYTARGVAAVPRAWTGAVAVDLNHDGVLDIAGFIKGTANVDVLLNSGDGTFSRFQLFTDDPVLALVPGDFDGDLVSDLAILTGQAGAVDEDDDLLISYGTPAGGPGDPISMGTFGAVDSLAPATIHLTANDPEEIADLVVVTDRDGHRTASVLLGSSSRQVTAPFEILDGNGALITPTSLVLVPQGPLGSGTPSDLVVISAGAQIGAGSGSGAITFDSPSLWPLAAVSGGDLTLGSGYDAGSGADNLLAPQFATGATTVWVEGLLTLGAHPSVIGATTLAAAGAVCGATELVIAVPPTPAVPTWTISDQLPVMVPAPGTGECWRIHGIGMRDLDGDGLGDAVMQLCTATTCQHAVNLYAPGQPGTIDVAHAVALPLPVAMACGRPSPIVLAPGAAPQLVVTCEPETGANLGSGTPAFSTPVLVVLALDTTLTPPAWAETRVIPIAATDLRTGLADFNGDGLTDLAITAGTGEDSTVQIYLQCGTNDPSCVALPEVSP